jgi:hypothetical protein
MNWRWLLLVILTAVFSFGGSFECRSDNAVVKVNDDDHPNK